MKFPDIETTSFADTLDVPVSCLGCPTTKILLERLKSNESQKEAFIGIAQESMDGMPEEVKEQFIEHIQHEHAEEMDDRSPEEIITNIESQTRQDIANKLDELYIEIDKTKSLITDKLDNCDGKLTLRARRSGAEYLVTICGSRAFSQLENPSPAIVKIKNSKPEQA